MTAHTPTCAARTEWTDADPLHVVRLACRLPAGHEGEHACAELVYVRKEEADE